MVRELVAIVSTARVVYHADCREDAFHQLTFGKCLDEQITEAKTVDEFRTIYTNIQTALKEPEPEPAAQEEIF